MKHVFLIGDSIRLGYERYVTAMLEGKAVVYSPKNVNGGMAQFVQRWAHVWARDEGVPSDVDVVHWNAGLWDVLRICGDDTFTSPQFYAETLEKIVKRMKRMFPKAKIVFAFSTAVREEKYLGDEYKRYNADIERFNEIAKQTLSPYGVIFNDLYSITKDASDSCYSDPTHFNTLDGIQLVGNQVVRCICEQIGVDIGSLNEREAELFEIPERILCN